MNKAVELVSEELNISIPEFTVVGFPHGNYFAHKWYVACDDEIDENVLRNKIDKRICELNDDYGVERGSAFKDVFLQKLPEDVFFKIYGT